MNLGNRRPRPRSVKVQDPYLKKTYGKANPYCEACLLEGVQNSFQIELHHIIPGHGRTDEIWNIIRICKKHHTQATYHIVGLEALQANVILLSIKWLKGELPKQKIYELSSHFAKQLAPHNLITVLAQVVEVVADKWKSALGHEPPQKEVLP